MRRVQEKIKDLVDVRTYETIRNFASDAVATVAAYRFTDVTADLMAKWLDEIVELCSHRTNGAARALAGNRGVGKSHFLAVLGALTSQPELRTRLTDQHVGLSAQRLPRQKHFVVNIERGLSDTLAEEFRAALNKTFNTESAVWGENPAQMLAVAAERAGELPLIVIVDSAYDRKARVKRDDGEFLGEMAETARNTKTFLAIALDDDIAGADGVNAAIARTCVIDYLDQEHLYRIVEAFLYQKRPAARHILRELYQGFRHAAPGFNWSEPRFASLYPIHPVVVDITPAVRLYAPKFAFLPFAAETAAKVMNRPAHSLVALDEVFDRVEPDLRKSAELEETFAVYDKLTTNAISQIPIMQRLQAKLILKGLLLTSLDGRGATARELGATMLIYDENEPLASVQRIEEIIALFANAVSPEKLRRTQDDNEMRYSLGNSAAANFESKLAEAAQTIEHSAIGRVMRRIGSARFSDWKFGDSGFKADANPEEIEIVWRGSARRGRVFWFWNENRSAELFQDGENFEWQLFIVAPGENLTLRENEPPAIIWQPAQLRRDEEEAVRRFAALLTNSALTEEFAETAIAAEQTTAAIIERIWTRVLLDEGKLIIQDAESSFTPEAKAERNLASALEIALAPVFEARLPAHPDFDGLLTTNEVSQIVSELFGGANPNSAETQRLAETFAAPLGLVAKRGANWALESDENLLKLPLIQTILHETDAVNGKTVSLNEISQKLKAPPHGLQPEAQNLLLAALVARRRLEFVTTTNDRITHRSLDLKIIWSDVAGVAKSSIQPRTSAELANWASLLTGVENLTSIEAEREKVLAAFNSWLTEWQKNRLLARFDELSDMSLNVRSWRVSQQVARSFGAAAEAVSECLKNELSLEDALERVIDAFGDAPESIAESRKQVAELECFINAANLRETVWRYVARAEVTNDSVIEGLRREILEGLAISENAFDERASCDFENIWQNFLEFYTEFYLERHNASMHSSAREETLEQIEQSAEWSEFLGLANLSIAHPQFLTKAENLRAEIKAAKCNFDARQVLQTQPFCACGFRLIRAEKLERLPDELMQIVAEGRANMRRILIALAAPLATALTEIAASELDENFASRARSFADALRRGDELAVLSPLDLRLLEQAVAQMPVPTVRVRTPRNLGTINREEMRSKLNLWLDRLPNAPVLVKLQEDE